MGVFDIEDHGQSLYSRVVRTELARRLPDARIRVFAPYGPDRPTRSDRGEPAEAIGRWTQARLAELAAELDLVVIGGEGLVAPDDIWAQRYATTLDDVFVTNPGGFFVATGDLQARWHALDGAGEATLRAAGVTGPVDIIPHPAVLAPRLFPAALLRKRLQYLRLMDWYPSEGSALVVESGPSGPDLPEVLELLDSQPGPTPVVVGRDDTATALVEGLRRLGRPVRHLPACVSDEDFVAALSAAGGYLGSSAAGGMAACAYGVPRMGRSGSAEQDVGALQSTASAWLDRIAEEAVTVAAVRRGAGDRLDATRSALEAELRALRLAYRVRTERTNAERVMLADRVTLDEKELSTLRAEVTDLRHQASTEADARARYEAELVALRLTRTFRWTAAARALYGKAGGRR